MKYSVIIPVYNSEKYLEKCVQSILVQSHKDLEVILVDDESNDSSPYICDSFAHLDNRIKVIHKENGGTADSRNVGLQMASGDYIMFMDNDDYWKKKNALRDIDCQLNESHADVLMYDTMEYWENKKKFSKPNRVCNRTDVVNHTKESALKVLIEQGVLYRAVWAKVVKRDLIIDNNLFFEKGIRNEDTEWTAKMLLCAESYDWYEQVFYVYRKGTGVAQTDKKVSFKEVNDLKNILKKYISIANEITNSEFQKAFRAYLAFPYAVLVGQVQVLTKNEKKAIGMSFVKKNSNILRNDMDPTVKKVACVYRILGYYITAFMLKIYFLR
jgi:glycosyltransferase involved in cell wall biosynthesis